jgi:hypothetical protein
MSQRLILVLVLVAVAAASAFPTNPKPAKPAVSETKPAATHENEHKGRYDLDEEQVKIVPVAIVTEEEHGS